MLQVGDKLPNFNGINQNGETISSKNYLGRKLIVFFYPKASTPGCTAEACNLRDHYTELKEAGFELLGVSADEESRQKKFADKNGLPFNLLADTHKEVIEAFGVWQLKKFMGREFMGIVRTTFVFDENSICTEVISKVETKNHSAQLLK
ncbi:thioredoxin-dependent thiol peroxidase [Elizabethkingia sp. JS20170427COW]|uniref:thioredoxin-dependent thiol peroxidase n=1 Tax=Elizabethkingia sp. JS20170427COW TaxID=2583851 RepID=UPI00110FF981|nr:thioredoxin-dependent thiol peroxidase [Elizabethkingia sp. JS20170427COW]QCX53200.1 thioredoxin-dependent thiol peroxidase [Elizabethkingia sp. JS20170427COW]